MSEEWTTIRDSGQLELYVLGELNLYEKADVEAALAKHPELRDEVKDIERALMSYADLLGIEAPENLRAKVVDGLGQPQPATAPPPPRSGHYLTLGALLFTLAVVAFLWWSQQQLKDQLTESQTALAALEADCAQRNEQIAAVLGDGSRILPFQATEGYPETRLYLSTNDEATTNYLQVQNLPALADGETFQLWSLGAEENPVPLDTFGDDAGLLSFEYVAGSGAYAITIEPAGGSASPNLDRLIGVVQLTG